MLIYLIFIFSIYFGFLLIGIMGWLKFTHPRQSQMETSKEFVSLMVPIRNEEHTIGPLLVSLQAQDFPYSNFEVVFVDDHSMDHTDQKIMDWIRDNPHIQCSYFHSEGHGKKHALTKGILLARGNIILTTDADCSLPVDWISRMVMSFAADTTMVIGLVKIQQGKSLFSRLQALEFSSLLGSGIALLSMGYPVMCNGASLAFRKSSFEAVNGYEGNLHIPSGDDEFLMRKLNNQFRGSVRPIHFPSVVVSTQAQSSVKNFVNQRLRWAGKWKANDSLVAKGLAFFILVFQLTMIITIGLLFFSNYRMEAGILLGTKLLLECYFLFSVSRTISQRFSITAFLILQVLYPFYILIVGTLSQLIDYEWKGRKESS